MAKDKRKVKIAAAAARHATRDARGDASNDVATYRAPRRGGSWFTVPAPKGTRMVGHMLRHLAVRDTFAKSKKYIHRYCEIYSREYQLQLRSLVAA